MGKRCTSTLFMSFQQHGGGASVLALRDEALMRIMLRFLARLVGEYGQGRSPPEPDYSWGCSAYVRPAACSHSHDPRGCLAARIPDTSSEVQRGRKGPLFVS
jgi:hypothetical protein